MHYSDEREGRTWKRPGKSVITALLCKINYFKLLNLSSEHCVGALRKRNLLQIKILSAAFENEKLENTYEVEPPSFPFY